MPKRKKNVYSEKNIGTSSNLNILLSDCTQKASPGSRFKYYSQGVMDKYWKIAIASPSVGISSNASICLPFSTVSFLSRVSEAWEDLNCGSLHSRWSATSTFGLNILNVSLIRFQSWRIFACIPLHVDSYTWRTFSFNASGWHQVNRRRWLRFG